MFKVCFKNFFKNIKYVFVEVGFMYLALLFGFEIFIKRLGIGFDEFKEAFSQVLETGEFSLIEDGLMKILESFSTGAVGFIAIQLVGLILGFIAIELMMRKDIEKRNIFKVLLSVIVDAIILAIFIVILGLITSAADWGGIVAVLIFLPLYSIFTLFSAYVNHGLKAVTFKKAVSFRNMFKLAICNFLIIVVTIGIGALIGLISNIVIGITLVVALVIVGVSVITLNADSYVVMLVENAKLDKKIKDAKEEAINTITDETPEKDEEKDETKTK